MNYNAVVLNFDPNDPLSLENARFKWIELTPGTDSADEKHLVSSYRDALPELLEFVNRFTELRFFEGTPNDDQIGSQFLIVFANNDTTARVASPGEANLTTLPAPHTIEEHLAAIEILYHLVVWEDEDDDAVSIAYRLLAHQSDVLRPLGGRIP